MNYLLFKVRNGLKEFIDDESGAGVIELVFLFKDKIGTLLSTVFSKINSQAESIYQ